MTEAEGLFQQGLKQFEEGQSAAGEASVRESLALAEASDEYLLATRARCVLGNLLLLQGRATEAVPFLQRVLSPEPDEPDDDLIEFERRTARELLAEAGFSPEG